MRVTDACCAAYCVFVWLWPVCMCVLQGPYAATVLGWHTNGPSGGDVRSRSDSVPELALKVFLPRTELHALREAYPHGSRSSGECLQAVVQAITRACAAPECSE
jgi:hypothetical protein